MEVALALDGWLADLLGVQLEAAHLDLHLDGAGARAAVLRAHELDLRPRGPDRLGGCRRGRRGRWGGVARPLLAAAPAAGDRNGHERDRYSEAQKSLHSRGSSEFGLDTVTSSYPDRISHSRVAGYRACGRR